MTCPNYDDFTFCVERISLQSKWRVQVVVISLAQGPVEQVPDLYHNYLYSDQVRNESVSKNNQILLTFMAFSFDDTHKPSRLQPPPRGM